MLNTAWKDDIKCRPVSCSILEAPVFMATSSVPNAAPAMSTAPPERDGISDEGNGQEGRAEHCAAAKAQRFIADHPVNVAADIDHKDDCAKGEAKQDKPELPLVQPDGRRKERQTGRPSTDAEAGGKEEERALQPA